MKNCILTLLFSCFLCGSWAAGIKAEHIRMHYVEEEAGLREWSAQLTVSWRHAWRNGRNHDAAWIFFKLKNKNGRTSHLKADPARMYVLETHGPKMPKAALQASSDSLGLYLYPAADYRGDLSYTLKVHFKAPPPNLNIWENTLEAYALEMVYIPEGPFTLGDPDTLALEYNAFYRSGPGGQVDGLYTVLSEEEIAVGPEEGALYYRSETPIYNGDQKGPIPAAFPKGFRAFYIMKYEITQGQYAAFLNNIDKEGAAIRANFGGPDYYSSRGTIRLQDGHYVAGVPERPLNFVSWEDGIAFADWAALRPMTEFEFTKACRGGGRPTAREYPWGTGEAGQVARIVDTEDNLVLINGYTEADLNDDTRPCIGASYYWVMDLAGSVWEKVITPGNETGRQFDGRHGDGRLGYLASANVPGWPDDNDHKGGYGYRGGGFYEQGKAFSAFNPYSPIAYRRFGAWSGGPRYIAYGFRCARTAD